jgi:formylglycine-generating enzyme required for sulfatase activity
VGIFIKQKEYLLLSLFAFVCLCGKEMPNNPKVPLESCNEKSPGMVLILSDSKSFQMGKFSGDSSERPVHNVTFSYNYYMDTTEVTQADYKALTGVNPSYFQGDSLCPVEQVTWFDAVLYCNKRSIRDGFDTVYQYDTIEKYIGNSCGNLGNLKTDMTKNGYRLPTEAEWEYACRAGTKSDYYWGNDTNGKYCWYYVNSYDTLQPVAKKVPNLFGLYDMAGNVAEWCNDWFGNYSSASQNDPIGPISGTQKVFRGGSCFLGASELRSSFRTSDYPMLYDIDNGFRVVRICK